MMLLAKPKSDLSPNPSRVQLLKGTAQLPILSEIALQLTVEQVFNWLTL
jgi:hypothetical protein